MNFKLDNLIGEDKKILVTGGAGFIGTNLILRLLNESSSIIYNLDKLNYASNLDPINKFLSKNSQKLLNRYNFLKVDLSNQTNTNSAIQKANPDYIMHLAAESHVDRSIIYPDVFIKSNIVGTFNLLNSCKEHYEKLSDKRKSEFKFLHVSTDEVFGSLPHTGSFSEKTSYDPRSPYSSSKASSDHLVKAWFHTFKLPTIITNCSNNFGPYQYPDKLIPLTILNALNGKTIPIYGDGKNIRDWLFVQDHIEALLLTLSKGKAGESYCVGGFGEKQNIEVVNLICEELDRLFPKNKPHNKLIKYVEDRLGHDKRYSINPEKIKNELGWKPNYTFEKALKLTIKNFLI